MFDTFKVKDFKSTKNDVFIDRRAHIEPQVTLAITIWKDEVCKAQSIDQSSSHWSRYPQYYVKRIVRDNSLWPLYLPIGYVFVSFIQSTNIEMLQLEDHMVAINTFLSHGDIISDMYKAYERGEFYKHPGPVSNELLSGNDQAKALYEPPQLNQSDLFDK